MMSSQNMSEFQLLFASYYCDLSLSLSTSTTSASKHKSQRHVAAIPGPGRGHVNPMLNFCRLLASRGVHVSFIVTEEWLGLIGSPLNPYEPISFVTVPDVIPSHKLVAVDLSSFNKAIQEDLHVPVQRLLEKLEPKPDFVVADSCLLWGVEAGRKMKIPVASFWPASASQFSALYHHDLVVNSPYYPLDLSETGGEERIDFMPGISSIRLADLSGEFQVNDKNILAMIAASTFNALKAQCIIFRTVNELEEAALSALRATISLPIYAVGPAIPCFKISPINSVTVPYYVKWLDTQHENSVLYISQGSAFSTSDAQMNELVYGLKDSGIPFLWVGRDQTSELGVILEDRGIVVEWCDQMRVLSHPSVGGFLTHCGWNSTLEAAFAGIPTLTFPLCFDQFLNNKLIVEDWGIGWRVKNKIQDLASKEQIATLLKKFINLEDKERKKLDEKCKKFKELLLTVVEEDGSIADFDEFLLSFLPSSK